VGVVFKKRLKPLVVVVPPRSDSVPLSHHTRITSEEKEAGCQVGQGPPRPGGYLGSQEACEVRGGIPLRSFRLVSSGNGGRHRQERLACPLRTPQNTLGSKSAQSRGFRCLEVPQEPARESLSGLCHAGPIPGFPRAQDSPAGSWWSPGGIPLGARQRVAGWPPPSPPYRGIPEDPGLTSGLLVES